MGIHMQPNTVRRDVHPADAWRAVKLAIKQTVAQAGGVEAVAAQCRVGHKARVSEWQNPNSDDFPNLWQVAQLEGLAGVDWITQAMAALHDADLIRRPREGDPEIVTLERVASFIKETGEAHGALGNTLVKGDAKSRATAIRELQEAQRAGTELMACLVQEGRG